MNKIDIESLFDKWNTALQTGLAKKVTQLYAKDAILIPTISARTRRSHNEIEDYFILFQKNKPKGEINESYVRHLGKIAIHSGSYTFTFDDNSKTQARYTFVYRQDGNDWKIIEHHSSRFPE